MHLFQKYYKLIILFLIIILIYIIYQSTKQTTINYTALGDSYALGINSFGQKDYSYTDYLKDYFLTKNKLNNFDKTYTSNDMSIDKLYNYIIINKKMSNNNKKINLKQLLRESDIVTLSIGLNDLLYKLSIIPNLNDATINKAISEINSSFKTLITEIRKYYPYNIYVIGYYPTSSYSYFVNNSLTKLNNIFKNNKEIIYISTTNLFATNSNLTPNPHLPYPNNLGYQEISKLIISKLNNAY